jgi:hypothetical protein
MTLVNKENKRYVTNCNIPCGGGVKSNSTSADAHCKNVPDGPGVTGLEVPLLDIN